MGNSGTSGADESRRTSDPDEPGDARRQWPYGDHPADMARSRRDPDESTTPPTSGPPAHWADSPDAASSPSPAEPCDADTERRWGEGYPGDVAPEWPLTSENRVVETATPQPSRPPNPSANRFRPAAEPERPHRYRHDTTIPPVTAPPAGANRDAAEPERPYRPVTDESGGDAAPERPGDAGPGHDETVPAADDTTVPPRPTVPGHTTVLPAIVASETAGHRRSSAGGSQSGGPRHLRHDDEAGPPAGFAAKAAGHARIPGKADPGSAFLVAQDLSATGSAGPIFTSVSVAAELGEIVTIVGDAGTGRTALLLALAGRFKYRTGSLTVDGDARPARIRGCVAIACAPPAVVFEEHHTVAAVLTESALVGGVTEAQVRRCCDQLRLDLDTGTAFGRLTQVERTLLALASAWASGAPVIAVDDLDAGVDAAGTQRLWEAARRVADDWRLVLATAVRAGNAGGRSLHPRPLALAAGPHRGDTEPPR